MQGSGAADHAFLDDGGFSDKVELEFRKGFLVIRPVRVARKPRQGWEQAFRSMALRGDDRLLDGAQQASDWDKSEWEWK